MPAIALILILSLKASLAHAKNEFLKDCLVPLADFSQEEPDVEARVRKAINGLSGQALVWKRTDDNGYTAAIVSLNDGND